MLAKDKVVGCRREVVGAEQVRNLPRRILPDIGRTLPLGLFAARMRGRCPSSCLGSGFGFISLGVEATLPIISPRSILQPPGC
jgi:hypothetical protein